MPFKIKVKRKICRYHREGYCSKGDQCSFLHNDGNVKICLFHRRPGGCIKDNCQYAHPPDLTSPSNSRSVSQQRKRTTRFIRGAQYSIKESFNQFESHQQILCVTRNENVTFQRNCHDCPTPSCQFIYVRNQVDEYGFISEDNLNEKIIPKKCCSQEFELEDKYLEHLAMTHFYDRLRSFLESANIGRERNLQCPRGCDSLFENYDELVLHYGVFEHAKVISLAFQNFDSVLCHGKRNDEEIEDSREQLAVLSTKINSLTSDNDKYKQRVSDLQQSNLELGSNLSQLNDSFEKTKKNLENMEEERDQLDELHEELKLKSSKILKSKDAEISDLKKQLKFTQGQVVFDGNKNAPCLDLNSDDAKDEDLKSELVKTKSELEAEMALKDKLRIDFDSATSRIEILEEELKRLGDNFVFLKSELDKKDKIIKRQENHILPYLPKLMEII